VGSDIEGLEAIVAEKFRSVDQQLELVERQRVEQKKDTKDAVDAALTAQKEAVREQTTASERAIAKSEAAMTKQLEQLGETFKTAIGGLTDALADLKDRVTAIEAVKQGGREQRSDSTAMFGYIVGALGVLISIGTLVVLFVAQGNGP
jgi:cobalamin biosynthesis Mg chelatase CobN